MNIYYLGPEGSYSYSIAKQCFDKSIYRLHPISSFKEIIERTLSEGNSIGILPVENSTTSNVHENVSYIFNKNLKIIGEAELMINIQLVGLENADLVNIRKVYSHPKALEQASEFLQAHNIESVEVSSTSEGRDIIISKNDPTLAAIGSSDLTQDNQLEIIENDIGNANNNKTRFVFISQDFTIADEEVEKITVTFKTKHEPGSLASVLTKLAQAGGNLTKIESSPIPGTDFEYNFWVDIEIEPEILTIVIDAISKNTLEYKIVGKYLIGKTYQS